MSHAASLPFVTRIVVGHAAGRAHTERDLAGAELSIQDDGRTLKVFTDTVESSAGAPGRRTDGLYLADVTRVEIIGSPGGRKYTGYFTPGVEIRVKDDRRTLLILADSPVSASTVYGHRKG
jgi:hypothetical protein